MVVLSTNQTGAKPAGWTSQQWAGVFLCVALVLTLLQWFGLLPSFLNRLPETWMPPFAIWLDAAFNFVRADIGHRQSWSQGKEIDTGIKTFLALDIVQGTMEKTRCVLNVWILNPFRDFLLSIPTSAFILLIVAGATALGGASRASMRRFSLDWWP